MKTTPFTFIEWTSENQDSLPTLVSSQVNSSLSLQYDAIIFCLIQVKRFTFFFLSSFSEDNVSGFSRYRHRDYNRYSSHWSSTTEWKRTNKHISKTQHRSFPFSTYSPLPSFPILLHPSSTSFFVLLVSVLSLVFVLLTSSISCY